MLLSHITGDVRRPPAEDVTLHDPCYLARYAGHVDEPRALLARVGAAVREPVRNRENPFCCGAGGGLLFEEHEEGRRISQERFEQLQATGAGTIVTACPFCSIMLKGAQASSNATTQVVDIMTYVDGRLKGLTSRPGESGANEGPGAPKPGGDGAGEGGRTLRCTMSVPPWRASWFRRAQAAAIVAAGYPLLAALGRTLRWEEAGASHLAEVAASGRPPILALWHGRIPSAIFYFRDRGVVAMTSENFDGEWIAGIMRRFGYAAARGSTSRGAKRALLQMKRDMAAGKWTAFTVDGPRGPAYRAQSGAVWLAKATGNPVVAFHIEAERCWTAKSWDRTQIPKPWSRRAVVIDEPLYVREDADEAAIECARVELERRLARLQERALAMIAREM